MPTEIRAWQDSTGKLHDDFNEAILADCDLELHAWVETSEDLTCDDDDQSPLINSDKVFLIEMIKNGAEQLHEILTKYNHAKQNQMREVPPNLPFVLYEDPEKATDK